MHTIFVKCGVFQSCCRYTQLPECQVQIASDQMVLEQLMGLLSTPSFGCVVSIVVLLNLENLSFNPKAHRYLATSLLFKGLLDAYRAHRHQSDPMDAQLLRYLALVVSFWF